MAKHDEAEVGPMPVVKRTREELLASIFAHPLAKPTSERFTLFGVECEFRPPTVGGTLDMDTPEGFAPLVVSIINFTYIPDSNEKLFSMADYDRLRDLPMGGDMTKISNIVARHMGMQEVEEKAKN